MRMLIGACAIAMVLGAGFIPLPDALGAQDIPRASNLWGGSPTTEDCNPYDDCTEYFEDNDTTTFSTQCRPSMAGSATQGTHACCSQNNGGPWYCFQTRCDVDQTVKYCAFTGEACDENVDKNCGNGVLGQFTCTQDVFQCKCDPCTGNDLGGYDCTKAKSCQ